MVRILNSGSLLNENSIRYLSFTLIENNPAFSPFNASKFKDVNCRKVSGRGADCSCSILFR